MQSSLTHDMRVAMTMVHQSHLSRNCRSIQVKRQSKPLGIEYVRGPTESAKSTADDSRPRQKEAQSCVYFYSVQVQTRDNQLLTFVDLIHKVLSREPRVKILSEFPRFSAGHSARPSASTTAPRFLGGAPAPTSLGHILSQQAAALRCSK